MFASYGLFSAVLLLADWRLFITCCNIPALLTDVNSMPRKLFFDTELEAYSRGSWWDVKILRKAQDKYLVHYIGFDDQSNEWLPVSYLRIRSRTSNLSDCCKIHAGIDVCVMTQHPHSEDIQPVRLTPLLILFVP